MPPVAPPGAEEKVDDKEQSLVQSLVPEEKLDVKEQSLVESLIQRV